MEIFTKPVSEIKLSELLISHLCHELVGAAGAIGNGVEYIEENSDKIIEPDVLNLLNTSSKQLNSRIKFYRVAYGFSNQSLECLAELRSLTFSLLENDEGCDLDWPISPEMPVLKEGDGRLLLNLIIIAKQSLPMGGVLEVDYQGENHTVTSRGSGVRLTDSFIKLTTGEFNLEKLSVREVHEYYTLYQASTSSKKIVAQFDEKSDYIEFTINDL